MYEARPTGLELLASWIKTLAGEAWQPETDPWSLPKAGKRKNDHRKLSRVSTCPEAMVYHCPLSPSPPPQNSSNKI